MRRAGGIAALALGLVLAGCTGGPVATPSPTEPATAGSSCPDDTSSVDGLCLSDDPAAAQLADALRSAFTDDKLGAVIAGVWHDGEPVLVGALGESMAGVPATPDMHHFLGNLATPMYATVVLQQVEAGVIDLKDPLSNWFPEIPGSEQVTLDMLLHNTSGYTQFTAVPGFLDELYADPFRHWTNDEVIPYGVGDGPTWTPGTDWGFSDTNTLIMVNVIEKATGRPFAELLQEGVLDPLGMDDTTVSLDANWLQPVLHGYTSERGVWEDATFWNPGWASFAGGLGSNQEDVARFLDALATGELLSPALYEAQVAPTLVGIGTNKDGQYWGMGALFLRDWAFLNPDVPGYTGAGATLPGEGWTIVVYNTKRQDTDLNTPFATEILRQFTAIVSPEHSLLDP
jgi:D-alanyl-D-alanine carboxypeptidase